MAAKKKQPKRIILGREVRIKTPAFKVKTKVAAKKKRGGKKKG